MNKAFIIGMVLFSLGATAIVFASMGMHSYITAGQFWFADYLTTAEVHSAAPELRMIENVIATLFSLVVICGTSLIGIGAWFMRHADDENPLDDELRFKRSQVHRLQTALEKSEAQREELGRHIEELQTTESMLMSEIEHLERADPADAELVRLARVGAAYEAEEERKLHQTALESGYHSVKAFWAAQNEE